MESRQKSAKKSAKDSPKQWQEESPKGSRILEAAQTVFLRYGFKRVTMNDIAEEAGISRPALYLVFANKEEVFKAAVRQLATRNLQEIRLGLGRASGIEARLKYVFEVWTVQPFELLINSPNAKDLVDCGHTFAKTLIDGIFGEFEELLTSILKPYMPKHGKKSALSAREIAHLLAVSTHGFKEFARSPADLRQMIAALITLTLAGFDSDSGETPRSVATKSGGAGGASPKHGRR